MKLLDAALSAFMITAGVMATALLLLGIVAILYHFFGFWGVMSIVPLALFLTVFYMEYTLTNDK